MLNRGARNAACLARAIAAVAWLFVVFRPRAADACMVSASISPVSPTGANVFPNWLKVKTTVLRLEYCDALTCAWGFDGSITGVTIVNYGTAGAGEISQMYFCLECGTACAAPTQTLTYAGVWTYGASTHPAWTWDGSLTPSLDPCDTKNGCTSPCFMDMPIWVDIGSCPLDKATIALGPGYNPTLNPLNPGGISDIYECNQPWDTVQDGSPKTIVYVMKTADRDTAPPGDTISYTIFYGRPGVNPISKITIFDSMASYTSYLPGSASPALDGGWDPDFGPPQRVQWNLAGPFNPAGGPTGEVRFQATVDWGNQPIEMESGPNSAPEGERLKNFAQIFYENGSCPVNTAVTPAGVTTVRRFLFWEEADNDVLFSNQIGQPADEIIYSIFIKNVSTLKTWWNVTVWDTVPMELDSWCPNCGFDDPCTGWTMTPSGCVAATPGRKVAGGQTLLTWKLDMPPRMTLTLRWKAQVKPTSPAQATATSIVSMLEYGFNGINGTGHSGRAAFFTHLAPIILPTTYVSYTSYFGADKGNTSCPGIMITFFPLNRKTEFTLYGLEYINVQYSTYGGVSDSIGNFIGNCTGGFAGFSPGGTAGCKAERTPAMYKPVAWVGTCPTFPYHFVYKNISNSPVLWQTLSLTLNNNQDHMFYAPTTTMSFRGFCLYTYRRAGENENPGIGDSLTLINTSMNAKLQYDNTLSTVCHIFRWDSTWLSWYYISSMDLDVESLGVMLGTKVAEEGFYRVLSSQAHLIMHQSWNTFDTLSASGCCDNHAAMAPTRESGNIVSGVNSGNFYLVTEPWGSPMAADTWTLVWVANVGKADATYRIWRYDPYGTSPAPCPSLMGGTSGRWTLMSPADTAPWGMFPGNTNPPNPHAYGGNFDRTGFVGPSTGLFKVELTSGGPIEVECGNYLPSVFSGGAVLHATDGNQTGQEFWFSQTGAQSYSCTAESMNLGVFDLFCPKTGMAASCISNDGASSSYTTAGADQVITFMKMTHSTYFSNKYDKRNWKLNILPNASAGNVVALYNMCMCTEKGYTSPFMTTGTHYVIVTPQVVYAGQPFWMTIIVVDATNATMTDYCGTTSFTATDPTAMMQGSGMESFNFAWSSLIACNAIPNENGVNIFVNVIFNKIGMQSLVASDIYDGSITGLASLMVVGVDVKLIKEQRFTIAASGDTVQFKICWSNYSSASGFTFVITDAVPVGTAYVPELPAAMTCGSTDGVAVTVAFSSDTTTPATAWTTASGLLPTGVRWLRWTVPIIGVETSGCACYKLSVN